MKPSEIIMQIAKKTLEQDANSKQIFGRVQNGVCTEQDERDAALIGCAAMIQGVIDFLDDKYGSSN